MTAGSGARRLRIERIELDLRGITPADAQAVARALGPALAHALALAQGGIGPAKRVGRVGRVGHVGHTERIDAGRIVLGGAGSAGQGAQALAGGIARRIAHSLRKGEG